MRRVIGPNGVYRPLTLPLSVVLPLILRTHLDLRTAVDRIIDVVRRAFGDQRNGRAVFPALRLRMPIPTPIGMQPAFVSVMAGTQHRQSSPRK